MPDAQPNLIKFQSIRFQSRSSGSMHPGNRSSRRSIRYRRLSYRASSCCWAIRGTAYRDLRKCAMRCGNASTKYLRYKSVILSSIVGRKTRHTWVVRVECKSEPPSGVNRSRISSSWVVEVEGGVARIVGACALAKDYVTVSITAQLLVCLDLPKKSCP